MEIGYKAAGLVMSKRKKKKQKEIVFYLLKSSPRTQCLITKARRKVLHEARLASAWLTGNEQRTHSVLDLQLLVEARCSLQFIDAPIQLAGRAI